MTRTVRGRAGWVVPTVLLAFAVAAGCTDWDGGDSEATADAAEDGGESPAEASADATGAEGDGAGAAARHARPEIGEPSGVDGKDAGRRRSRSCGEDEDVASGVGGR